PAGSSTSGCSPKGPGRCSWKPLRPKRSSRRATTRLRPGSTRSDADTPMSAYEDVLKQRFGADSFTTAQFRDNRRVIVPPAQLFAFLQCLKQECGFDMLAELTAVDYLRYPDARDR